MYLLIDLSYACFNKFYATKKYYSLSKPEISLDNVETWHEVPGFIEQFTKSFKKDIFNIKKKLNINWNQIIFAKDCARKNIWRNEIYQDYKGTRDEMHKKQKFNGGEIFVYMYNTLIPNLIKEYGVKLISCQNAEGDDIIAVLTKYLVENKNEQVTIIANDNDYLQLLNENIFLANIKLKYKHIENNKNELWIKILSGDTSDNILPCQIKKKYINENCKNNNYVKCTKSNVKKLLEKETFLVDLFSKDIISNNQHIINRNLIDFNFIPNNIKSDIIKEFLRL